MRAPWASAPGRLSPHLRVRGAGRPPPPLAFPRCAMESQRWAGLAEAPPRGPPPGTRGAVAPESGGGCPVPRVPVAAGARTMSVLGLRLPAASPARASRWTRTFAGRAGARGGGGQSPAADSAPEVPEWRFCEWVRFGGPSCFESILWMLTYCHLRGLWWCGCDRVAFPGKLNSSHLAVS